MNYYNENDKVAAEWLRQLILANAIPPGDVDERSIEDVTAADLAGYKQCHFFAGIGGWPLALALAGVSPDFPLWTGSCPCQPFSAAGKGSGFADERHLWPAWFWLIAQRRPELVLGEQVASKDAEPWLDLVQADMEGMAYAFGATAFSSASVGAPHIRDRTYWLGDANRARLEGYAWHGRAAGWQGKDRPIAASSVPVRLAYPDGWNAGTEWQQRSGEQRQQPQDGGVGGLADSNLSVAQQFAGERTRPNEAQGTGSHGEPYGRSQLCAGSDRPGPTNGFWRDADWLLCTDGKWRPVEPGTFPLAHGVPARVGRLRGYGNAINPYQAAAFVRAVLA